MSRRYRARPRLGCYPGCLGCSIPLLAALVAIVTVIILG